MRSPADWWTAVLGFGYRGTVDQLTASECEQVRRASLEFIHASHVREVEANVIYAIASK